MRDDGAFQRDNTLVAAQGCLDFRADGQYGIGHGACMDKQDRAREYKQLELALPLHQQLDEVDATPMANCLSIRTE